MATQKFSHLSAKSLVKPLGTLTMNGSIGNQHVQSGPVQKAMIALIGGTVTGNLTVTITGNTTAAGDGTHTVIKTMVYASTFGSGSVEVDSEEISYAEGVAGAAFLSLCFRLTGTNTDTVKAAVQVVTHRQYENQTPTGTGTLT